jgi:hypothetical protein
MAPSRIASGDLLHDVVARGRRRSPPWRSRPPAAGRRWPLRRRDRGSVEHGGCAFPSPRAARALGAPGGRRVAGVGRRGSAGTGSVASGHGRGLVGSSRGAGRSSSTADGPSAAAPSAPPVPRHARRRVGTVIDGRASGSPSARSLARPCPAATRGASMAAGARRRCDRGVPDRGAHRSVGAAPGGRPGVPVRGPRGMAAVPGRSGRTVVDTGAPAAHLARPHRPGSTRPARRQGRTAPRGREPRHRRVAGEGQDHRAVPRVRLQVLASYGHIRDLPRSDFAVEVDDGGGCHLVYEVPERPRSTSPRCARRPRRRTPSGSPPTSTARARRSPGTSPRCSTSTSTRPTGSPSTRSPSRRSAPRSRPADAQHRARRRAAGPPGRRPHRRLPAVAGAVAHRRLRHLRGPGAVVALRMIVDREDEIRAFVPEEYWSFPAPSRRQPDGGPGDRRQASTRSTAPARHPEGPRGQERGEAGRAARRAVSEEEATRSPSGPGRSTTPSPRCAAPRPSASPSRRSRPRRCRARRPSTASPPGRRWPSPSSSTRASTSAASRSGSSPTCGPTR